MTKDAKWVKPKLAENLKLLPEPTVPLTKEDVERLLREGQEAVRVREKERKRGPGDYEFGPGLRGSKTKYSCKICSDAKIEILFTMKMSHDHFRPCQWESTYRCSSCGLVYDLRCIDVRVEGR